MMLFLTVVLVHGGNKTVFAATSGENQCKVTFANSEGRVSTEKYRRWARTVKKGAVIKLPKVTKTGYKAAWETKISGKTKQYNPGSKVTILENTYNGSESESGVSICYNLEWRHVSGMVT